MIAGCHSYIQFLTKAPEEGVFLGMLATNRAFKVLAEKALKAIQQLEPQLPSPPPPAAQGTQAPSAAQGTQAPSAAPATPTTPAAPNTVEGVVKMAVGISLEFHKKHYEGVTDPKQKLWLHPASILYWFAGAPAALRPNSTEESAVMLSALLKSYCIPSPYLKYLYNLQRLVNQTGIFTFKQPIWTPNKPKMKVARGYQLTELTLAVPFGAKLFSISKDQPKVVGPEKLQTITLNLLDSKVVERFGEVWMVINEDGSLMIASQNKPNISIFDLLGLVKTGGNIFNQTPTTLSYSIGINSLARLPNRKLPNAIQNAINRASTRTDNQVVIP